MQPDISDPPFIVLIDDDDHSAYLLTRMLAAHGAPPVRHFAAEDDGEWALLAILNDHELTWPGLVIVDLKANSGANLAFVTRISGLLRQKGIPLVVMVPPTDRQGRQPLLDAGASAIFFRQAELDAYRREVAAIVSFWARHQCLDAIGM